MTESPSKFTFLGLPGEIRNRIYRLLLRKSAHIGSGRQALSSQILRTCRLVHDEAISILYGENTFQFRIYNIAGPFYDNQSRARPLNRLDKASAKTNGLQYIRRFRIVIQYTDCHKVAPIREAVRDVVGLLQKVPAIDYLELDCRLHCQDTSMANYRQECWDNYRVDDDGENELIRMVRTWLGLVRNVKAARIQGLPRKDGSVLMRRWKSHRSSGRMPLTNMYEILEKDADTRFLEVARLDALEACETDDQEKFKSCMAEMVEEMERRCERVKELMTEYGGKDECGVENTVEDQGENASEEDMEDIIEDEGEDDIDYY
jgi:hypothetical protein